jgi:hypothetical protein
MAYELSERYTLALDVNQQFRLPAVVQENQNLGYNDGVSVTIYPEDDDIESLTFDAWVNSNMKVNVPVSIVRRLGISGETVTVSVEPTGERWSPEAGPSARKAVYESAHPDELGLPAVTNVLSADD